MGVGWSIGLARAPIGIAVCVCFVCVCVCVGGMHGKGCVGVVDAVS